MKFHYLDSSGAKAGPYSAEELRQLHLSGVVNLDTPVFEGDSVTSIPFREVWPRISTATGSAHGSRTRSTIEDFTSRTTDDIRALIPHLLVPLQDIRSLKWIGDKRLLAIAIIGLLPLFLLLMFAAKGDARSAYWGLALYFSGLWAVFFYYVFPAPRITLRNSVICFFGTGVISIAILLMAHEIPPLSWVHGWTRSSSLLTRIFGYIFGVGLPEELCKSAVLFFLAQRRVLLPPQSMLFYGLMSGLGFGIYEGVGYQTGANLHTGSMGAYYLNNMLRLTSLPFLHAIWSGIAGYFIGFAFQYPQRKAGLLVIAIALPSLLHGLYDVANHALALIFATLSVLALYLYLAKSVYFESVLAEKPNQGTPPNPNAAPPRSEAASPSAVPPFPPASA